MAMSDRRRDARMPITRPIKLQCAETGRYMAGRTSNLSAGGALLEVDHPSLLVAGQRLRLGIAWQDSQAVLASDTLAEAIVIRSLGSGTSQSVAIQFARRQALAVSA
jgi:hypothetical protein